MINHLVDSYGAQMLLAPKQEAPQLGMALDVKAAINGMLMHLAKASLTDHMREVAAAAMALRQHLQAGDEHAGNPQPAREV